MPNAFSPNGDGLNDVFRIRRASSENYLFFSFQQVGTENFQYGEQKLGMDGNFGNQAQPPDTYVWQIKYQDLSSGKVVTASGTVLLVR